MGGTISVDSTEGKGTAITFTVPFELEPDEPEPSPPLSPSSCSSSSDESEISLPKPETTKDPVEILPKITKIASFKKPLELTVPSPRDGYLSPRIRTPSHLPPKSPIPRFAFPKLQYSPSSVEWSSMIAPEFLHTPTAKVVVPPLEIKKRVGFIDTSHQEQKVLNLLRVFA